MNTHSSSLMAAALSEAAESRALTVPSFEDAYRECFAFVYRNARRLGVREANLDDVVQDVFLVVHRRLPDYDACLSLRGWVYGILANTVREYRRSFRRKEQPIRSFEIGVDAARAPSSLEPGRQAEQHEAFRFLLHILDQLDDEKREVLILSKFEQMTVPEIALVLGANLNTIYSRLKAAEKAFAMVEKRERARASAKGSP